MTQFATLTYTYTSGAWYAFCYCFVPVCKIWITSKPLKLQDPGCSTMISMVRHEVSGHLGTISWEKFGFWYFIELVPPSGLCAAAFTVALMHRGHRSGSGGGLNCFLELWPLQDDIKPRPTTAYRTWPGTHRYVSEYLYEIPVLFFVNSSNKMSSQNFCMGHLRCRIQARTMEY